MIRVITILALITLAGCESREKTEPDAAIASPTDVAMDEADQRLETDSGPDVGARIEALELNPPLEALPRPYAALEKELADAQPVGEIGGKIFKDAELLAVVREECGEGAILQPVFRQDGALRIGTPVRLPLFSLATNEEVSFKDRVFDVTSHFSHDSAERLAGKLTISYPTEEGREAFIDLQVDTKPLKGLMKPRLDGDGPLPSYPKCTPTGYARVASDEQAWSFLVHADNVDNRGVPWVWVSLRPSTLLQIMVIAPKPNTEIQGIKEPMDVQQARSKSSRPAVIRGKFLYTDRIAPDAEATSENLVPPEASSMLDGKVTELSLVKQSDRWRLRMTLEEIMIPEMLDNNLAGRKLDEIRIDTFLAPPGSLEPRLPDEPEWWRTGDE